MKHLVAILITACGLSLQIFCQPPAEDSSWDLNTTLSDEFANSSYKTSLWHELEGEQWMETWFVQDTPYVVTPDTCLHLRMRLENDTIKCGGLASDGHSWSYGYLEVSAKLPGWYDELNPKAEGLVPCFWTWAESYTNNCYNYLDEIDILEPDGLRGADSDANVVGLHDEDGSCDRSKYAEFVLSDLPTLFEGFHKYAVEWLPNRAIFYFDDEPFWVRYYDTKVPNHNQRIAIDQQIDNNNTPDTLNTPWNSLEYVIDWFRYYEQDMHCQSDESILSQNDLDSFDFAVYEDLTIGNGTTSISLSSTDKMTFRASSTFTINGTFTVPQGAVLNLIYNPCY